MEEKSRKETRSATLIFCGFSLSPLDIPYYKWGNLLQGFLLIQEFPNPLPRQKTSLFLQKVVNNLAFSYRGASLLQNGEPPAPY
jgi:hypothetical protein